MYKVFFITLTTIIIALTIFSEFGFWAGIFSLIPLKFVNNYLIKYFSTKKYKKPMSKTQPPDKVEYYFKLAGEFARRGYQDKAIENFTKCISINPKNPHAYFNRGLIYVQKKMYDRAIDNFDHTISLDPQYTNAYLAKASLCEEFLDRPDEAAECYRKFLQYAPSNHKDISSAKKRLAKLAPHTDIT